MRNFARFAAAIVAGLLCLSGPAVAQGWGNEWQRPAYPSYQRGWGQPSYGNSWGEPGWGRPSWRDQRAYGADPYGWGSERMQRQEAPRRRAMPKVKVSNPSFLNYTADALATVALSGACAFKVASSEAAAGTAAPAAAPRAEAAAEPDPTGALAPASGAPAPAPSAPAPDASFVQGCAALTAAQPPATLRALPQVGAALAKHYSEHPRFLWSADGAVTDKARAALATLAAADTVGLDPADYRVTLPALEGVEGEARALALVRFDLALSAKTLTYLLDATRGRIDPNRISGYHDLPRKSVDLVAALGALAQADDVAAHLAEPHPRHAQYRALVAELAQQRASTAPDAADKIAKLRVALEQTRWLPREFGARYVFLNQPAYEVTYVNGDAAPLTMRVVIGKPDAQTYFFTDRIRQVVYNPYWNVPRSIVINEMLPKLWRDPSWLSRQGYEVVNRRGREVASASVDWGAVATDQVGVDVRQPPGRGNALGQVKIEFPNRHAIYMHDTPQKHLFARAERAFSHGCVRLQHPREMAAALLGTSVAQVDRRIASGANAAEAVTGDIPVYLAYFTAWPDRQGGVHYYKDVYRRDAHVLQAIGKTEAARRGS